MEKKVIIIAGPTASGKTALAIKLAQHLNTNIISADSRQCFKELNIGVAKPSAEQLAAVFHYFINSHSITQNVSAADFENYALEAVQQIFLKNNVAVVCGGTGLYIKAFCEGLDVIPAINQAIKQEIANCYAEAGIQWLQQRLIAEDAFFTAHGEMKNPHRMLRALEVKRATGSSILTLQTKQKKKRSFKIVKIFINPDRPALYNNINKRVDEMILQGLEEEAAGLLPFRTCNALQTVGYREMFEFFDDKISRERAIELIKQNTRNYAKRQLTWFKKDDAILAKEANFKMVLPLLKI